MRSENAGSGERTRRHGSDWKTPPAIGFYHFAFSYIIVAALIVAVNYPGRLTLDTHDMLIQSAIPIFLDNWQSPTITKLYGIFSPPLMQPVGALIVQALLLAAFPAALLLDRPTEKLVGVFATVIVIGIGGTITRDMVQTGALITMFAALIYLHGLSRIVVATGMCALFIVTRPSNFIVIAFAACLWSLLCMSGFRRFLPIGAALAMVVTVVPMTSLVDNYLWKARDFKPQQSVMIYDLAGISVASGRNMFAAIPGFDPASVPSPASCYSTDRWDEFGWGHQCKVYKFALRALAEQQGDQLMTRAWTQAILSEPAAYLTHRARIAWGMLKRAGPVVGFQMLVNRAGDYDFFDEQHNVDTSRLFLLWHDWWLPTSLQTTMLLVFNRAALVVSILALAGLFIWGAGSARQRPIMMAAILVGFGNLVMLFFFTVANEGRYLLPTYAALLIAISSALKPLYPRARVTAAIRTPADS